MTTTTIPIEPTTTTTGKRSQPSRKGKKAWRKNITVEDEEEGLQALVREKMEYGDSMTKVDDGCLFVINTDADKKLEPKTSKRESARDRILANKSAIAPIAPRIVPKPKAKVSSAKPVVKPVKKVSHPVVTPQPKEIQDPWGDEAASSPKKQKVNGAVPTSAEEKKALFARKSLVSGVELNHSGASYNPKPEDLNALKTISTKLEGSKPTSLQHHQKKILMGLNSVDLAEAAHEMVDTRDPQELDQVEATEEESKVTKVLPKKLTKKGRRNKIVELKNKRSRQARLDNNRLQTELNQVKSIKKQIETETAERQSRNEVVTKKRKLKELLPAEKMGGMKVPHKPIAVASKPSESLRQIQTANNLYKDQFIGFQARNLIEPPRKNRKPLRLPRYKLVTKD